MDEDLPSFPATSVDGGLLAAPPTKQRNRDSEAPHCQSGTTPFSLINSLVLFLSLATATELWWSLIIIFMERCLGICWAAPGFGFIRCPYNSALIWSEIDELTEVLLLFLCIQTECSNELMNTSTREVNWKLTCKYAREFGVSQLLGTNSADSHNLTAATRALQAEKTLSLWSTRKRAPSLHQHCRKVPDHQAAAAQTRVSHLPTADGGTIQPSARCVLA